MCEAAGTCLCSELMSGSASRRAKTGTANPVQPSRVGGEVVNTWCAGARVLRVYVCAQATLSWIPVCSWEVTLLQSRDALWFSL